MKHAPYGRRSDLLKRGSFFYTGSRQSPSPYRTADFESKPVTEAAEAAVVWCANASYNGDAETHGPRCVKLTEPHRVHTDKAHTGLKNVPCTLLNGDFILKYVSVPLCFHVFHLTQLKSILLHNTDIFLCQVTICILENCGCRLLHILSSWNLGHT